jgi:hypothetical protein
MITVLARPRIPGRCGRPVRAILGGYGVRPIAFAAGDIAPVELDNLSPFHSSVRLFCRSDPCEREFVEIGEDRPSRPQSTWRLGRCEGGRLHGAVVRFAEALTRCFDGAAQGNRTLDLLITRSTVRPTSAEP